MTAPTLDRTTKPASPRFRAPSVREVRLACGLVLFTYVSLHYLNHALGLFSVAAMEEGLNLQKLIWQSVPGALVLYAALLTHMSLGFWALYERRQFRWTRLEATQLVLGLTIPFLLADHVFGTRVALSLFGADKGYAQELYKFGTFPPGGVVQGILLLIVWIHGCIGVHFWLALKPVYPKVKNLLLSAAVLTPTLALIGYAQGERETLRAAADPAWRALNLSASHVGTAADAVRLAADRSDMLIFLAGTLAGVLLVRAIRAWRERWIGSVRLTFPDRTIRAKRGLSVLEASLIGGVPLAHVCGGRGRCSTCRIRILGDLAGLPDPERRRTGRARPHPRRGRGAARLPAQAEPRHSLPAAPSAARDARRRPARTGPERRGALRGGDVRRYARFDPARREAAALRHGVPDQPVSQRRQQRGD